ncbi:peptidase, partial [Halomonas sp. ND22Bw]
TYDTAQYSAILQSTESGYGVEFAYLARTPPRQIRVAYTEPGSPAAQAGLVRGMTLLAIDGIDVVNAGSQADVDRLNAALAPSTNGQAHAFQL